MNEDIKSAKDLFGRHHALNKKSGKPMSERATLLGYFSEKSGIEIGHIAFMVGHLKDLRDLYYLKSDCDQAATRGVPFSAAFRKALKLEKK